MYIVLLELELGIKGDEPSRPPHQRDWINATWALKRLQRPCSDKVSMCVGDNLSNEGRKIGRIHWLQTKSEHRIKNKNNHRGMEDRDNQGYRYGEKSECERSSVIFGRYDVCRCS